MHVIKSLNPSTIEKQAVDYTLQKIERKFQRENLGSHQNQIALESSFNSFIASIDINAL